MFALLPKADIAWRYSIISLVVSFGARENSSSPLIL